MRTIVAATAITILAAVGVPAMANTAVSSTSKPQPPPKIPKRKLSRQIPSFTTQPRVVGAKGKYVIQASVMLHPWRTATRNQSALKDKYRIRIDVAKPGTQIRYVGLDKKSRKQGLMWSGKVGPRVIDATGNYTLSVSVPQKVATSLASDTRRQRWNRMRMTVLHRKDVSPQIPGREALQLAQSGPLQKSRRPELARLSGNGQSTTETMWLINYTPFDLDMSFQGVNCISDDQWSGSLGSYGYVSANVQIYTSGTAMANDFSSADSLSSAAVTALKGSAQQAGQQAANAGSALFTPSGAASEAVSWAVDFIGDFIKALEDQSCKNQPTLWTTSAVVTGSSVPPSDDSGWFGVNQSGGLAPSLVTFPSGASASQMLGAQSSTQWQWQQGDPEPSANGSFNWAGGLMSMDEGSSMAYYFESDASNPTGYGPAPTVWPPNPAVQNSAGLTATWDGANMVLNCNPGQWDLYNPWGDSLAITPGALSPPNNNAYSSNQMYMQVAYNGTDASGDPVFNEPFTGVEPVTAYSTQTQAFTIDSSALQGISVTQWQCSVGAAIQVQNWAVPASWPSLLGPTPNGTWWNAPNLIVSAPYVAP